jgi:hypothetical protein
MMPEELPALQERITRQILADLRPVSPMPRSSIYVAILLSIAAFVVAAGAWHQGTAGFSAQSGAQSAVVFGLLAVSLVAGAMLVATSLTPAARHHGPLAAVLTASVLSLSAAIVFLFPYKPNPNFLAVGMNCWRIGMAYSLGAALLSFPVLRRAAWLSPVMLGTVTGVSAGLSALTVQEIYCPYLDARHIAGFHVGTLLSAALLGAILGLTIPRIPKSLNWRKQCK